MTNKFKVGDKVKRVQYIQYPLQANEVYEVVELLGAFSIVLKGIGSNWVSEYFEPVEDESLVDIKDKLFISNSEEEAKVIQDYLFSLGYQWYTSPMKEHKHLKARAFGISGYGHIVCDYSLYPTKSTLYKVIEKKSYEIVPIEETIEYNGKKYNKQAFEQAIANLESK